MNWYTSTFFLQNVQVLILAPSKELCKQIKNNISELTVSCRREVRYVDVSGQVPLEAQRPLLIGETFLLELLSFMSLNA